jgi:hypothetical protein
MALGRAFSGHLLREIFRHAFVLFDPDLFFKPKDPAAIYGRPLLA